MAAEMAADAACDERENKRAHTASQCWSANFPEDLLVLVYTMIASSPSRSCFAAVCRSWRAAARAAPPVPALPRLLLSPRQHAMTKALYCLEDGARMHLQLPEIIIGGHDGGWVALSVSGLIRIVNLFSGAEVALDEKKATIVCPSRHHATGKPVVISRVVFSAPPTSSQCILAAVTQNCGIALCRVGRPNNGWAVQGCHHNNTELVDIRFCNGKLYGLYSKRKLVRFEIRVSKYGVPWITAEHRLVMPRIDRTIRTDDYRDDIASYIFNLDGDLAMASKARWLPNIPPFFKVFKIVDIQMVKGKTHHYKGKWMEVTSLGDQALFLGKSFSKAVHVPANMCGLVERNRIYYSHYCWLGINTSIPSDKVFLKISNECCSMTCYKEEDSKNAVTDYDDDMKRIMSVGYFMQGGLHGGMWIFPPNMHPV